MPASPSSSSGVRQEQRNQAATLFSKHPRIWRKLRPINSPIRCRCSRDTEPPPRPLHMAHLHPTPMAARPLLPGKLRPTHHLVRLTGTMMRVKRLGKIPASGGSASSELADYGAHGPQHNERIQDECEAVQARDAASRSQASSPPLSNGSSRRCSRQKQRRKIATPRRTRMTTWLDRREIDHLVAHATASGVSISSY